MKRFALLTRLDVQMVCQSDSVSSPVHCLSSKDSLHHAVDIILPSTTRPSIKAHIMMDSESESSVDSDQEAS